MTGSSPRRWCVALLTAVLAAAALVPLAEGQSASAAPAPTASPSTTPAARPSTTPTALPSTTATTRPSARPSTTPSTSPAPTPSASAPPVLVPLPVPTGTRLAVLALDAPVLTLPAGDGLRDRVRLRVQSGATGQVDVLAKRGSRIVVLQQGVALAPIPGGFQRTVVVRVGALISGRLQQGGWRIVVRRSADHSIRASLPVRVGSGRPTVVTITPATRTLYPYRDRVLDALDVVVGAVDETGSALPLSGTVRIDAGPLHRTRALVLGGAHVPVVGLPLGAATVTAAVTAPGGATERTTSVTLAPDRVGPLRLTASTDTVQPVVDGLLDSVALTTSGAATAGSPAPVSGTLVVSDFVGTVKQWRVPNGSPTTFTWDGRVDGAIVPGVYTVTLTLKGPEGAPRVRTAGLTVSKDHLPYRVRDLFGVAAGDQQGLAVHDGLFYVATDVGAGSSRIDVYDAKGVLTRTIGPLAIGHGAALSFSTTTGLLYAANGGPTTPTTVWALDVAATDPAALVKQTFDLSALGPNGMVGVDDAGGRLLVFAGVKDAYTLSAVGFDGTVQRSVPIVISGTPQGLDVVGGEVWVYTSLRGRNRLARYTVTDSAVIAASTGTSAFDLMNPGEGEGFASSGADGAIYVGAHGPNRVGVLEPVADE